MGCIATYLKGVPKGPPRENGASRESPPEGENLSAADEPEEKIEFSFLIHEIIVLPLNYSG